VSNEQNTKKVSDQQVGARHLDGADDRIELVVLDLDAAAPVRSVERLRTPVLLIQGLRDTNVSPAHARAIAASGRSVILWLVPGAGHTNAAATDTEGFKRRVLGYFEAAS